MQVNVSGHHVEITEPLREYVTKRLQKLAEHCDRITKIQVTLSVEKVRKLAEATLRLRGVDIVATAEHEDMYAAIDLLSNKLDRQILKNKEKKLNRTQGGD